MSHNIKYFDYPETASEQSIESKLGAFVETECYQECGKLSKIRWLYHEPFNSYDEAEDYIHRMDNGWYDNLTVRYKSPSEESKAYKDLKRKENVLRHKLEALDNLDKKNYFENAKSSYIGCKGCGSKISRTHLICKLKPNHCPVCGTDLRPATILEQIEKYRTSIADIKKKQEEEKKKMAKKGKVRWLVKIEYHTYLYLYIYTQLYS